MIQKLIRTISLLALLFVAQLAIVAAPATVYAADPCATHDQDSSQGQVLHGVGQTGTKCDDHQVTSSIAGAVNIISYIAGILGLIFIIVAGLRYITSGGDSNKVGAAKTTLINAVIGLAIAAIAQAIVYLIVGG